MSVQEGPGEGTWAVFAEKVMEERNRAYEELARVRAELPLPVLKARASLACESMIVGFLRAPLVMASPLLASHVIGNAIAPAILELDLGEANVPGAEEIGRAVFEGLRKVRDAPPTEAYVGLLAGFDDDALRGLAEQLAEIWAEGLAGRLVASELGKLLEIAARDTRPIPKGVHRDDVKMKRSDGFWHLSYRSNRRVIARQAHPMLEVAAYLLATSLRDWRTGPYRSDK